MKTNPERAMHPKERYRNRINLGCGISFLSDEFFPPRNKQQ
jgi:hypothetical protein